MLGLTEAQESDGSLVLVFREWSSDMFCFIWILNLKLYEVLTVIIVWIRSWRGQGLIQITCWSKTSLSGRLDKSAKFWRFSSRIVFILSPLIRWMFCLRSSSAWCCSSWDPRSWWLSVCPFSRMDDRSSSMFSGSLLPKDLLSVTVKEWSRQREDLHLLLLPVFSSVTPIFFLLSARLSVHTSFVCLCVWLCS